MLTHAEIQAYLQELDAELCALGVKGELCLFGGAVMCLVYQARPSTKDVDAIFEPTQVIRQAAQRIAQIHELREDWLNDAVKGFVVPHPQRILFEFPCLQVYVPEPDYLLAMKAMAARVDTQDKSDILFLINQLDLTSAEQVFTIIEDYYPRHQIRPAGRYFIEELFES